MKELERVTLETESHEELRRLHLARYEFACKFVRNKTVLDAACGTGYGTATLAARGAREIIGVDLSDDAIAYAREHFAQTNLRFVKGDVQNLSFGNEKDVVVSFETIEHLPDPEAFLHGITMALKTDGVLLISTPLRLRGGLKDKPSNPFHIREWNENEFVELLKGYFGHLDIQYQYNFRKFWYPYSRTLSKVAAGFLYPSRVREFLVYPVQVKQDLLPGIPILREYVVVVCSKPIKASHRGVSNRK